VVEWILVTLETRMTQKSKGLESRRLSTNLDDKSRRKKYQKIFGLKINQVTKVEELLLVT